MNCIICEGKYFKPISKVVRDSIKHRVVKCKSCGLVQLSPMPSIGDDKDFYNRNLQSKNIKEPTDLKTIRENSLNDTNRNEHN